MDRTYGQFQSVSTIKYRRYSIVQWCAVTQHTQGLCRALNLKTSISKIKRSSLGRNSISNIPAVQGWGSGLGPWNICKASRMGTTNSVRDLVSKNKRRSTCMHVCGILTSMCSCVCIHMYMWKTGQCQKSLSIALYLTFGRRVSHCCGMNKNCPPQAHEFVHLVLNWYPCVGGYGCRAFME